MEILGLAVIIVLVTLGMLFILRFSVSKNTPGTRQSFVKSEKAANLLNTLLKTTTDCNEMTVAELIKDCAETRGVNNICQDGDSGVSSCDYLKGNDVSKGAIKKIFEKTLEKWKNNYEFIVCRLENSECTENGIINIKNPPGIGCPLEKEAKQQPIQTKSGLIEVSLAIC